MDKKYRTLINVTSKIIVTIICSVWTEQILASNYAPVVDAWQQPQAKNSRYRVNEGDTLYSIAWAFNEDYQDLARANNLKPPYDLRVGQYLNMNITAATSQKQVPKPDSESEQKEVTSILNLSKDELNTEFNTIKETVISNLNNSLNESKEDDIKKMISQTIDKVNESNCTHYDLYKLKKLSLGL